MPAISGAANEVATKVIESTWEEVTNA